MVFTDDILEKIMNLSSTGSTIEDVAMELNMRLDVLIKERKTNKNLNDALIIVEANSKAYMRRKLIRECMAGKHPTLIRDLFAHLNEDLDNKGDNKIIIERV